ncbi:MAG: phosphoribosylanthranilate isomerase [Alphaproteobacteria bacterium]
MTRIKFCGLTRTADVILAGALRVDYVGLVFYPPSPRAVSLIQGAHLAAVARAHGIQVVALTVNAPPALYEAIAALIKPDLWQLHGQESNEAIIHIQKMFGKPVIKAFAIASPQDIPQRSVADFWLFDAKPAPTDTLPGGNGRGFDVSLIQNVNVPFFLGGGLTPETVKNVCERTHPFAVDVSSGIETVRGVKDPMKMRAFVGGVL